MRGRDHAAGEPQGRQRRAGGRGRLVRLPGLLDQPGERVDHERPGHRQAGGRGDDRQPGVPRAHAVQGPRGPRRGCARGRGGVRGCVEISGQDQVRPARLDGMERRHRAGHGGSAMTENTTTENQVAADGAAPAETPLAGATELTQEQEDVLEALRDVVDPELGINVVDLGLVYGVDVDADTAATIDMTLTSAACPLTDVIEDQAREALDGLVTDFRINWVWLPPWGPESITEDGREQLRALGFNI